MSYILLQQTKLGTDEPIDRSILWKEARKDASGNYVNERDKLVGDAIVCCKLYELGFFFILHCIVLLNL